MLKHYSHIRMEAKRDALDAVWRNQARAVTASVNKAQTVQDCSPESTVVNQVEGGLLQNLLQSASLDAQKCSRGKRKFLKKNGSSRIRTYNPSVNS